MHLCWDRDGRAVPSRSKIRVTQMDPIAIKNEGYSHGPAVKSGGDPPSASDRKIIHLAANDPSPEMMADHLGGFPLIFESNPTRSGQTQGFRSAPGCKSESPTKVDQSQEEESPQTELFLPLF